MIVLQLTRQLRIEHVVVRSFRKTDEIENFDFDKLNSNYNINLQKNIEIEKHKRRRTINDRHDYYFVD